MNTLRASFFVSQQQIQTHIYCRYRHTLYSVSCPWKNTLTLSLSPLSSCWTGVPFYCWLKPAHHVCFKLSARTRRPRRCCRRRSSPCINTALSCEPPGPNKVKLPHHEHSQCPAATLPALLLTVSWKSVLLLAHGPVNHPVYSSSGNLFLSLMCP